MVESKIFLQASFVEKKIKKISKNGYLS